MPLHKHSALPSSRLVVNIHSQCDDSWKETKSYDLNRMPCLTPRTQHPTLRRQNAILAAQEMPPPEVRIIRMCLAKRTTDVKEKAALGPHRSPSASPTRIKPLKKNKKKRGNRKDTKETESRLPLSVSSGRALGAQVHPLMAVLMSPRTLTVSFKSDSSGDEESEDTQKKSADSKPPQLTVTSLQLPDYAATSTYSHNNSLPPRRKRTSLRRTPRVFSSSSNNSITCSGSTFNKDNK